MRLHLPAWTRSDGERIANRLWRVNGIESIDANPLTGNVLIRFARNTTVEQRLLAALDETGADGVGAPREKSSTRDGTRQMEGGQEGSTSTLLRVSVHGLIGHAAVDSLWFAAGYLGKSIGLPLAALGPLHVLMEIVVWGMALTNKGVGTLYSCSDNQRSASSAAMQPVPAAVTAWR
jgi:hypothetical protein